MMKKSVPFPAPLPLSHYRRVAEEGEERSKPSRNGRRHLILIWTKSGQHLHLSCMRDPTTEIQHTTKQQNGYSDTTSRSPESRCRRESINCVPCGRTGGHGCGRKRVKKFSGGPLAVPCLRHALSCLAPSFPLVPCLPNPSPKCVTRFGPIQPVTESHLHQNTFSGPPAPH